MAVKKAVRKTGGKRTKKTCHGVCIYVWKANPKPHWHICFRSCHPGKRCTCPRPKTPGRGKKKIPPGTVVYVACISSNKKPTDTSTDCGVHQCTCDSYYDEASQTWMWDVMDDGCVDISTEEPCGCPLEEPDFEPNGSMHVAYLCEESKSQYKRKSRKKTS